MRINLPLIFKQTDSRWALLNLGFGTDPSDNIGNYGCVLTSLTNIACYYGKNQTPPLLNESLKAKDGFAAASANGPKDLYKPGYLTKVFSDIKEARTVTPTKLTDAQIAEMRTALDNHFPVMIGLDYNPQTVQADYHFVVLVDYNPNDENDFTIADPLTGGTRSLKDYLGWFKPSCRDTIESYAIFSGKVPEDNSGMIQVPAKVWPEVVHGSSEWDKTVAEYLPGSDPKKTNFEAVQSVVAGYKSRATTLQNEADDAKEKLRIAQATIDTFPKQLADKDAECQRKIVLLEQEISSFPDVDKIKDSYKGVIADLESKLGVANETVLALKKQLAEGGDKLLSLEELITKIVAAISQVFKKV